MRVILLWAMLGAYGLAALLGVVAVLSNDDTAVQLLLTSLLFGAWFTASFLLALLIDRGRRSLRWLMVIGICLAALATVLWLALLWADFNGSDEEMIVRTGGGLTFATLWTLYVGYCFCLRIRYVWFVSMTFALFACSLWFLFLLEVLVIDHGVIEFIAETIFGSEETFFRLLVALILLFTAASLSLPIIWLIARIRTGTDAAALGGHVEVSLKCPRCDLDQTLPVGRGHCARCRLEIRLKLEEPRCTCGFLLYRFEGDTCPECGRGVPEALRWSAGPDEDPAFGSS